MAKQYVQPEIDIVEVDANDGNKYSLPYGIAKGLGLDTTGMRPRQVWEMLKGRGITPENEYDKLKEKAQQELPKEKVEQVGKRDAQIKSVMTSTVFSKLPEGTKNNISEALKKLSDEDFVAFEKFHKYVRQFNNGSGKYSRLERSITFSQDFGGGALDKELGYDFDATTFFHEYGHFVDNMLSVQDSGPSWSMSSDDVSLKDDALYAFNEIMKDSGAKVKPLSSFDRISREQKDAFYAGLSKITGKDSELKYKPLTAFGYIGQPSKPLYTVERAVQYFGETAREHTELMWKQYQEEVKRFEQAQTDGTNKKAIEDRSEYEKKMSEHNKPIRASLERYGILSDFFGLYTNDRISPLKHGYWGHKGAYNKQMKAQGECFAEYFSFKMTNDSKGLDIMKKYLPKTFDAFEKKFNLIKDY